MPIYEYVCSKCDHEFELLIRGDESPACPACGAKRVNKRISAPSAHSRGGATPPGCPAACDPRGAAPM
ncbi:MAG: FmdB family zinc ribbon protein [Planctomycetota bacterium]